MIHYLVIFDWADRSHKANLLTKSKPIGWSYCKVTFVLLVKGFFIIPWHLFYHCLYMGWVLFDPLTSVYFRVLLSHFEGRPVEDVGGTERCCDNCSRRSMIARAEATGMRISPLYSMSEKQVDYTRELNTILHAIKVSIQRLVCHKVTQFANRVWPYWGQPLYTGQLINKTWKWQIDMEGSALMKEGSFCSEMLSKS